MDCETGGNSGDQIRFCGDFKCVKDFSKKITDISERKSLQAGVVV